MGGGGEAVSRGGRASFAPTFLNSCIRPCFVSILFPFQILDLNCLVLRKETIRKLQHQLRTKQDMQAYIIFFLIYPFLFLRTKDTLVTFLVSCFPFFSILRISTIDYFPHILLLNSQFHLRKTDLSLLYILRYFNLLYNLE